MLLVWQVVQLLCTLLAELMYVKVIASTHVFPHSWHPESESLWITLCFAHGKHYIACHPCIIAAVLNAKSPILWLPRKTDDVGVLFDSASQILLYVMC